MRVQNSPFPFPDKYRSRIAACLFEPIRQSESAYVRWFPGQGKTILLKQSIGNKDYRKKYLGKFYKRFLFIQPETHLFSSNDLRNYFLSVYSHCADIFTYNQIPSPTEHSKKSTHITDTLKRIIESCNLAIETGYEVVFVIDSIDDVPARIMTEFFSAWEHIIESNRDKLHTLINVVRRNILNDFITQSGLIQNIIQIPLPEEKDCIYFLNYFAQKWKVKLNTKVISKIIRDCGHDPTLLKESVRVFSRRKKDPRPFSFTNEPTLLVKTKINYGYLDQKEKETIDQKLKKNTVSPGNCHLAKELVALHFWNSSYHIPRLYETIILENKLIRELVYDPEKKKLTMGDMDLSKKLTGKEHRLLILLYENKLKTVSRDLISECLWSSESLENYSDWAIDKTVSRLRAKLTKLGFYYRILTKKKHGFQLEM